MSQFGKVAVLMGGRSAERQISLKSGMAVLKALAGAGIDAHAFDPFSQPLNDLLDAHFDRVFIAMHGRGGEDGQVQGALELLDIPYTGSGVLGCALAMDKARTKQIWQGVGLPTASSRIITSGEEFDAEAVLAELGGKVMVKPAHEGSSIGMSSASSAAHLKAAVATAGMFDTQVLIERWLNGPEYTVAILQDQALPAIRLKTTHEFYDYEAKYQSTDTEYLCPAGLSAADESALQELAVAAFKALDGRNWGRIDVMCDDNGDMFLLEANMVPGMTEKSLVPMAAKQHGLSFTDLVLRILAQTEA